MGTFRTGLLRRLPLGVVLFGILVGLGQLMVLGVAVGPLPIPPGTVLDVLIAGIKQTPVDTPEAFIVWQLRGPRVVTGALVGAALAVAGSAVQVLVRNPIADPYVLGMSSGAGVAAVAVITGLGIGAVGTLTTPFAAFLGAIGAGVLVVTVARPGRGLTPGRLVLIGVAVAQLLAGVMSLLLVRASDSGAAEQVMFWLLGSLATSHWLLAALISAPILLGIGSLLVLSRRLDLLLLGDEVAASAGARPGPNRMLIFSLAALLTGAAVAAAGTIGFVGLVVPHIARLLVGGRHWRVILVSAPLGAALLVGADLAARTLLPSEELPVGIFTAFIGVPLFVALLSREDRLLP